MSDISDKVRKTKSGSDNPQLTRYRVLEKRKSGPTKASRNLKRKSAARKKSVRALRESASIQKETQNATIQKEAQSASIQNEAPTHGSLSITEKGQHCTSLESESDLREVTPPQLSPNGAEKSLIWNDHREDELEARLKKLHKILGKIKEEKVRRLKDRVVKWQEKYARRLLDLELSLHNFETKCKCDKSEISEQISRVEEMSDMNQAIRLRIEKKLQHLAPRWQLEENNRYFTTATVNFVKGILYYTAQIRDAFWPRKNPHKFSTANATLPSSRTDATDSSEKYTNSRTDLTDSSDKKFSSSRTDLTESSDRKFSNSGTDLTDSSEKKFSM